MAYDTKFIQTKSVFLSSRFTDFVTDNCLPGRPNHIHFLRISQIFLKKEEEANM